MNYPLSPNGVFWTINGEGMFTGRQMCFIRLAGCSVGCQLCDTDYSVAERADANEIRRRALQVIPANCKEPWVWLTGGEPLDHDLGELIRYLHRANLRVALATSGHYECRHRVEWLSVSPHDPAGWTLMRGDELKLVPSLNGYSLADFEPALKLAEFSYSWVQPCAGVDTSLAECLEFCKRHPDFRLGVQAHKIIGVA